MGLFHLPIFMAPHDLQGFWWCGPAYISDFIFLNFSLIHCTSTKLAFFLSFKYAKVFFFYWLKAFAVTAASFWVSFAPDLATFASIWRVMSQLKCYFLREAFPHHPAKQLSHHPCILSSYFLFFTALILETSLFVNFCVYHFLYISIVAV